MPVGIHGAVYLQPPPIIPSNIPNLREFGATGNGQTDDTAAINRAIKEVSGGTKAGGAGGLLYAPPGVYLHEGELNLKELTGVRIIGATGLAGGGGIGVGTAVASTVFIYTGKGARAWDFRSAVACGLENIQCFAWGSGFTGIIWDLSGTVAKPSAACHFVNSRTEATRVEGKSTELIVNCIGCQLDFANEHTFDFCTFSSCKFGVLGVTSGANSSVGHRFNSCVFAGNQVLHVANPQEAWEFASCIAESLFNNKGEILNKLGFIGYSGGGFLSHGLNLNNCWAGSNVPASRLGAVVEFRGEGLNVNGGSYNTAEVGIFLPEGPIATTISGVRFWKVNSGILVTGKTIDSLLAFNRNVECIELLTDTIKERVGSVVQTANGAALLVS